MEVSSTWHLMKYEDGSVFGPITFDQLKDWADSAKIAPMDKVSNNEISWTKAPTIPELEMDYLLQMGEGHFYGPTTLAAVQEFIKLGEINSDTPVINCTNGIQKKLSEFPEFKLNFDSIPDKDAPVPGRTNIRQSLQARIRQLELLVLEERKTNNILLDRLQKAEAALAKATERKV